MEERINNLKTILKEKNIELISFKGRLKDDIVFKCSKCGKEGKIQYKNWFYSKQNQNFLCKKCLKEEVKIIKSNNSKEMWKNKTTEDIKIRNERIKQTKLDKYGDENYNNRDKYKQTCNKKYGVNSSNQVDKVKEKVKKTNLKKYGKEYISQVNEFKDKAKLTKLEKYGNENFVNNTKSKQTCLDRYGVDSYSKTNEFKDKMKQTNLEKYGISHYTNRLKASETCLEKYGVPYFCMADVCQKAQNNGLISKLNLKWKEFFEKNNIPVEMEFKLKDKSYDFHILGTNILIEINPTYTHQSSVLFFHRKELLDKNYHLNKTNLAKESGFQCIHIWDWDDANKIIGMLKPKTKLYARKLILKEINDEKICNLFFNNYHLQGTCKGQKIRLGLYDNDNLIQIMTFGKPRYNKKYQYELLRLCTHRDYIIIGGAERLFNYFLKQYTPQSIISYCDNSKFTGEVYSRLGFKLDDSINPSIHWSNGSRHITQNLLNQQGFDRLFNTTYGKGTSNRELMIQHNFYEIYDSGQSVWIYS